MENNKIKLFKRFIKDIGQYANFIKWAQKKSYHKMFMTNNKNNNGHTLILVDIYAYFSGEESYANEYATFLTKKVGAKKSFELFKNFIITNYGKETFNDFKKNISTDFIKEQTQGISKLNKRNTILSLPATAYLMYGFHWEESPQGHEFWSDINNEWFKTAETILSNYIYENNINK